ncbi:RNA polymerase sigma factor [Lewinella sp. LCG006]|uniref:RNA polymerase sigma factor n=1 Tax=Lewinella sp. LCG006 TaxID=3231911 RepID=UPI0034606179
MRAQEPLQTPLPPPSQENFQQVVEAISRLQPELVNRFKSHDFLDSEDLAQDVIIRVILGARKQFIRDPDAFIYRVTLNVCVDAQKVRSKLRKRQSSLEIDDCIERLSEDPFLVKQQAEDREAQFTLLTHVLEEETKPDHARLLRMRFWDKMSYKEIETHLGYSAVALRKANSRALKALRKQLPPKE